jgi:hypothetical protein
MKYVVLFLFFSVNLFAQIGGEDEVYLTGDKIEAKFNGGGINKFYDYINSNFDFSKVTKPGTMVTTFTVNELGEIKNIKVIQFVDVESATEIIRVLKNAPKWEPATRGGKPISIEIKFPLDFKLSNKTEQVATNKLDKPSIDFVSDTVNNKTQGGMTKFFSFLKKNYKTPDVPNLKGQVIVGFTINEDGTLSDFKIIKDLKYGTAEELIRVLKLTSGKWTPAKKEGKNVKSTFTLPISISTPPE